MKKVLIYHKVSGRHLEYMRDKHPTYDFYVCTQKSDMEKHIVDADVLISFKCSEEMLDMAPNIKWLQALSAGVDSFPLEKIKKRGIILTNGRGIHKIHMSEYAIGVLIMLARNFHIMFKNQKSQKWDSSVHQGEINGATLGILGLGSIGKEIARKASLLGMHVIGVKSASTDVPYVEKVYSQEEMYEVFRQSDYIINLLPGTKNTEIIINKKYFDLMKEDACFINMGRGSTVNEQDFIDALKSGKIRYGVSDVFYQEPLPEDSPFWNLDNLIITPHICGQSDRYFDRALEIIEPNLLAFEGKGEFVNLVDLDRGY
ncbi:D-2-hydroxyacid dehydrogenase [Lutispora thermophila]|uniref:Phosphoglycerate dehydrogenase n=1 Tax=Lutispora thermophila DSM 19022 TaxID=1122184 RepID=A0A1M6CFI9_9FIRM|nr:D-2-hydroxyacid dehydrogenase [Lutispora thermophila]SHI59524.1 Phosphoglycerate dehydrogenase [Lutispora thermophila DSM 19022]